MSEGSKGPTVETTPSLSLFTPGETKHKGRKLPLSSPTRVKLILRQITSSSEDEVECPQLESPNLPPPLAARKSVSPSDLQRHQIPYRATKPNPPSRSPPPISPIEDDSAYWDLGMSQPFPKSPPTNYPDPRPPAVQQQDYNRQPHQVRYIHTSSLLAQGVSVTLTRRHLRPP
jgi:hypothetical protein